MDIVDEYWNDHEDFTVNKIYVNAVWIVGLLIYKMVSVGFGS